MEARRRPARPPRKYRPTQAASDVQGRPPLALIGFMGSGKTVVGALVAQRSHAAFFDLDHLVEDLAGMSIGEIFATSGEQAFRALEKEALPRTLAPDTVVALGGGAVMNDDNWELISSRATTVYLDVPFEMLWARIHTQHHRPLVSGRTEAQVRELFDTRRARYEQAAHRVAANREAGEVADEVIRLWSA